jgi:hypothetical protein
MGMKRLILTVALLAFAVAVQADNTKTKPTTDKEKSACCASKQQVSATKEEAGAKQGCCCCKMQQAKKDTAKQPTLLSPKAADTAK